MHRTLDLAESPFFHSILFETSSFGFLLIDSNTHTLRTMAKTVAKEQRLNKEDQKKTQDQTATMAAKKRRFSIKTIAKRQILKEQKSKRTAIRRIRLEQLARAIAAEFKTDVRFRPASLDVIHNALEEFIVSLCRSANWARLHAKRETVTAKDLQLAVRMNEALPNGFYQKLYGFQSGLELTPEQEGRTLDALKAAIDF